MQEGALFDTEIIFAQWQYQKQWDEIIATWKL